MTTHTIQVVTEDTHKITDLSGKIVDFDYFLNNISQESYFGCLDAFRLEPEIDSILVQAIDKNLPAGITHCDTYQTETGWRIQLKVNIHLHPSVLYLLQNAPKGLSAFFTSKTRSHMDYVVITYNI